MTHTHNRHNTPTGEIAFWQSDDALAKIDVRLEGDTVWLSQTQLCMLCDTSKSNISEHIKHILGEGKLEKEIRVRLGKVGWEV